MADRRYERIVQDIRTRIDSAELRPGDRVPSARAITREWGVAVATATRALAVLQEEGVVYARPGVGTLVAEKRPMRTRGQRDTSDREVTLESIVSTAIDIADGEGLAAVSMRRIAIEHGVATMTLYRHVRGKNNLLLLIADTMIGQAVLPEVRPSGWRAQLELVARLQWSVYRQHPWLARIISMTRPQLLPNAMAHTEWALSAVDGLGLDANTLLRLAVNLFGYVRGSAMNVEMQIEAEQDTGLSDAEWIQSQEANFERVVGGRYPVLKRIIAAPELSLDPDSLFEFGLERLLDGYAALIDPHVGRVTARAPQH